MTQTHKLFSVCIPAYNRAHYLTALLDSIFDKISKTLRSSFAKTYRESASTSRRLFKDISHVTPKCCATLKMKKT